MDFQNNWVILIIEDDPVTARFIQKCVKMAGYEIQIASFGEEALKYIKKTDKQILALVDYTLPDMYAEELIDQIHSYNKQIPFIIISGNYKTSVIVEMVKLGAEDYIVKEEDYGELIIPAIKKTILQAKTKKLLEVSQKELNKKEEDLRESEEFNKTIVSSVSEGILVLDNDLRYVFWSKFMEDLSGMSKEKVLGKPALELFPHLKEQGIDRLYKLALQGKSVKSTDTPFYVPATGKKGWVVGVYSPWVSSEGRIKGAVAIIRDVTFRKQSEAELKRVYRALRVLSETNLIIFKAKEEPEMLKEICQIIVDIGGYHLAWIGFAEHNEEKSVIIKAQAGVENGYLERANITWADTKRGRGHTGRAIRTGQVSIIKDIDSSPDFEPWRKDALKQGAASSAAFPFKYQQSTIGALNIYSEDIDAFDEEEQDLLIKLADNISAGIDKLHNRAKTKQAEEDLLSEKQKLENIVKGISAGLIVMDSETRIVWVNDLAEQWLGSLDRVKGQLCCDIHNLKDPQEECVALRCRESGKTEIGQPFGFTYKGKRKYFQPVSMPIKDENGRIIQIIELLQDVTVLKQNEARVDNLLARILKSQDQERQRISQELHDGVGQTILAAKLNLKSHHLNPEEYPDSFVQGIKFIDKASDELREIYNNLHPSLLKDLGLESAIKWFVENYLKVKKINCNVKIDLPEDIADEISLNFYRIIQEASSNIVKYSSAKNVKINIKRAESEIRMEIEDDGKGFDIENTKKKSKGFGLENMRYRSEQMHGDFQIYSEKGKGTKLIILIPYEPNKILASSNK